jgi:Flavin reductase like domain
VSPGTVLGSVVADLRQVFLDLPQPVAVVTGLSPSGEAVGMTVSSLTPVSLAPPLVLFCPRVTSRAWAAARERGSFAVNILGHQQGEPAVRFAGPGDRFAGLRALPIDDGIPTVADARRDRPRHRVAAGEGHDPSPGRSNGTPRRPREASSRRTLRYTKTRPARRVDTRPARCQRRSNVAPETADADSPKARPRFIGERNPVGRGER